MNSPRKWPVKQKMFPFDDIIMKLHCLPVVLRPINPLWIYCIHHKGIHFNFRYRYNMFGASSQFVWIFMAYTFPLMWYFNPSSAVHVPTLQWHHNRRDGISNQQHLHCSLNRLFRRRSKKTSKEYILRKLVHVHAHTYIFKHLCPYRWTYCQVSNISGTLVGNKIVDHSDVVGAAPVGAAPTTSSFSTCLYWIEQSNCKTRRGTINFGDLARLILESLR